jgi:hypothetical protein
VIIRDKLPVGDYRCPDVICVAGAMVPGSPGGPAKAGAALKRPELTMEHPDLEHLKPFEQLAFVHQDSTGRLLQGVEVAVEVGLAGVSLTMAANQGRSFQNKLVVWPWNQILETRAEPGMDGLMDLLHLTLHDLGGSLQLELDDCRPLLDAVGRRWAEPPHDPTGATSVEALAKIVQKASASGAPTTSHGCFVYHATGATLGMIDGEAACTIADQGFECACIEGGGGAPAGCARVASWAWPTLRGIASETHEEMMDLVTLSLAPHRARLVLEVDGEVGLLAAAIKDWMFAIGAVDEAHEQLLKREAEKAAEEDASRVAKAALIASQKGAGRARSAVLEDLEEEEKAHDTPAEEVEKGAGTVELNNMVALVNAKWKGFKHNDAIETAHSCSFTEFALAKVSKDKHGRADILEFTERNIIRIYPGGNRVDSSNYDPQPAWNMGCQFVALNNQHDSRPMWLNAGFFRANGGCGFVRKPAFMVQPELRPNFDAFEKAPYSSAPGEPDGVMLTLHVRIISGHYIPKPDGISKELVDPFVALEMSGVGCDCNDSYKTSTKDDNGYNPAWDFATSFPLQVPELATLMIVVREADLLTSSFMGQYALPVSCIREGYRHVPVLSADGIDKVGSSDVQAAYIFCHFRFERHHDSKTGRRL